MSTRVLSNMAGALSGAATAFVMPGTPTVVPPVEPTVAPRVLPDGTTIEHQITYDIGDPYAMATIRLRKALDGNLGKDSFEMREHSYVREVRIARNAQTRKTTYANGGVPVWETKESEDPRQIASGLKLVTSLKIPAEPIEEFIAIKTKDVRRQTFEIHVDTSVWHTVVLKEETRGDIVRLLIEVDLTDDTPTSIAEGIRVIAWYEGALDIAGESLWNMYDVHANRIPVLPMTPFVAIDWPFYAVGPKMDGVSTTVFVHGTKDYVTIYEQPPAHNSMLYRVTDPIHVGATVLHAVIHCEKMTRGGHQWYYAYDIEWINRKSANVYNDDFLARRIRLLDYLQKYFGDNSGSNERGASIYRIGPVEFRTHPMYRVAHNPARELMVRLAEYSAWTDEKGARVTDGLIITPVDANIKRLRRGRSTRYTDKQPTHVMKYKLPEESTGDFYYGKKGLMYWDEPKHSTGTLKVWHAPPTIDFDPRDLPRVHLGGVLEMAVMKLPKRVNRKTHRMVFRNIRRHKKMSPNQKQTITSNIRHALRPNELVDFFGNTPKRTFAYLRAMYGALINKTKGQSYPIVEVGAGNGGASNLLPENAAVLLLEPNAERFANLVNRVKPQRQRRRDWVTVQAGLYPINNTDDLIDMITEKSGTTFVNQSQHVRRTVVNIYFVMTFINPDDYGEFFKQIEILFYPQTINVIDFANVPKETWRGLGMTIERTGATTATYRIPGIVGMQRGYIPDFSLMTEALRDADVNVSPSEYTFASLASSAYMHGVAVRYGIMNKSEQEYIDMIRVEKLQLS